MFVATRAQLCRAKFRNEQNRDGRTKGGVGMIVRLFYKKAFFLTALVKVKLSARRRGSECVRRRRSLSE